ncbi:hypothetical protein PYCC9005_001819 [Savitreella phatthalungensis]
MVEDSRVDVLVQGTSLANSLLAAALQQVCTVAHIDQRDYYAENDGNVPIPLEDDKFSLLEGSTLEASQYNLELRPVRLYTASPLIDILRDTRVNEYITLKALRRFLICTSAGELELVPSSKEDIFTSRKLPLIVKRRLMRFFKAVQENDGLASHLDSPSVAVLRDVYKLDDDLIDAIVGAIAGAYTSKVLLKAILPRIKLHLGSLGLFGDFPAVGVSYGAGAELAQAFCRKAAVKGAIYVLASRDKPVDGVLKVDNTTNILFDKQASATAAITSSVLRRVAIISDELTAVLAGDDGACVTVRRPGGRGYIQCDVHGSGLSACPTNMTVVHLTCSDDAAAREDMSGALASLLETSKSEDKETSKKNNVPLHALIEWKDQVHVATEGMPHTIEDDIASARDAYSSIRACREFFSYREPAENEAEEAGAGDMGDD